MTSPALRNLEAMRIAIEKQMLAHPENMPVLSELYGKLMDKFSEIEMKGLESQSTEAIRDMELRSERAVAFSKDDTDLNISSNNNRSQEIQNYDTVNGKSFNRLVDRGAFRNLSLVDLPGPRRNQRTF